MEQSYYYIGLFIICAVIIVNSLLVYKKEKFLSRFLFPVISFIIMAVVSVRIYTIEQQYPEGTYFENFGNALLFSFIVVLLTIYLFTSLFKLLLIWYKKDV